MTSADTPTRLSSKLRLLAKQPQTNYERPTTRVQYQSMFTHQPLPHAMLSYKLPLPTVLTLNIPITLSHSDPSLGLQPSSFESALASLSTRSRTSSAEYPNPVRPQVNGCIAWLRGHRPYCSFSMNSLIGMESGGSKGSFGTH